MKRSYDAACSTDGGDSTTPEDAFRWPLLEARDHRRETSLVVYGGAKQKMEIVFGEEPTALQRDRVLEACRRLGCDVGVVDFYERDENVRKSKRLVIMRQHHDDVLRRAVDLRQRVRVLREHADMFDACQKAMVKTLEALIKDGGQPDTANVLEAMRDELASAPEKLCYHPLSVTRQFVSVSHYRMEKCFAKVSTFQEFLDLVEDIGVILLHVFGKEVETLLERMHEALCNLWYQWFMANASLLLVAKTLQTPPTDAAMGTPPLAVDNGSDCRWWMWLPSYIVAEYKNFFVGPKRVFKVVLRFSRCIFAQTVCRGDAPPPCRLYTDDGLRAKLPDFYRAFANELYHKTESWRRVSREGVVLGAEYFVQRANDGLSSPSDPPQRPSSFDREIVQARRRRHHDLQTLVDNGRFEWEESEF